MRRFESKLIGVLAAALVLAGCGGGKPPTATLVTNGAGTRFQEGVLPGGQAGVPGAVPGAPAQGNAEGAQLLARTRQLLTTINGFDAQIRSYTQGHYKQGERVSELRKSTTEARLIWIKPLKLRAEVIQTTNPLLVGAAMATTDGKNVTARARGILGLIPFHLQITDPKLGNNRDHRLPANNPKAQMERLTAPTAVWTVVGDQVVEGTACKLVQVDGIRRLDKEITRELIGVDPVQMTLRKVLMFAGQTRVVEHTMVKFRWNPKVSAESFNL